MENQQTAPATFAAYVGLDWADQVHQYTLQVAGEKRIERKALPQEPESLERWAGELAQRFGGRPIAVGLEQWWQPIRFIGYWGRRGSAE
jgi:hypothetical protein